MAPHAASIVNAITQFQDSSDAPLRVHFPETTVAKHGTTVKRATAAAPPTLSISSAHAAQKLDTAKRYLAICLDLDAPYPSMAILGPIAHGIQTDLHLAQGGADNSWVALEAKQAPVLEYLAPAPPPLSGPHRYLFLLWEQPQALGSADIRSRLGLKEKSGMGARVRWNQGEFEKKLGLGSAVAGTYFVV